MSLYYSILNSQTCQAEQEDRIAVAGSENFVVWADRSPTVPDRGRDRQRARLGRATSKAPRCRLHGVEPAAERTESPKGYVKRVLEIERAIPEPLLRVALVSIVIFLVAVVFLFIVFFFWLFSKEGIDGYRVIWIEEFWTHSAHTKWYAQLPLGVGKGSRTACLVSDRIFPNPWETEPSFPVTSEMVGYNSR